VARYDSFSFNCKTRRLSVIRGGLHTPQQRQANALAALGDDWRARLDAASIPFAPLPFAHRAARRTLWLPSSHQALLLATDTRDLTLRIAEALDRRIGARPHADDLDPDVRVIFALNAGRFVGYVAGGAVLSSLDLNRCSFCHESWFHVWWGSFRCQVCGNYDGNTTLAETFSDALPLRRRRSA
jgi:hypothetical protein